MYIIKGIYNGRIEDIDEAVSSGEANYLVNEYALAYGSEWEIYYVQQ